MKLLKSYIINIAISFLITFLLLCLSAAIFAYTNINDIHMQSFVLGIIVLSVLVGSFLLTIKLKKKGLLYGLLYGFIYFILVYIISCISNGFIIFNNIALLYLILSAVSGIIGGIIGVNV